VTTAEAIYTLSKEMRVPVTMIPEYYDDVPDARELISAKGLTEDDLKGECLHEARVLEVREREERYERWHTENENGKCPFVTVVQGHSLLDPQRNPDHVLNKGRKAPVAREEVALTTPPTLVLDTPVSEEKGRGVVKVIREMVLKTTKSSPVKVGDVVARLAKLFPKRGEKSLLATVKAQLTYHLKDKLERDGDKFWAKS
jgi:hypothetical protein